MKAGLGCSHQAHTALHSKEQLSLETSKCVWLTLLCGGESAGPSTSSSSWDNQAFVFPSTTLVTGQQSSEAEKTKGSNWPPAGLGITGSRG